MKKLSVLIAILAIVALVFTGCSSKVVTWNTLGEKTVTTRANEDIYHEQQAVAWTGYYKALENPPVIATIQQIDGSVLTINSQIPPPAPIIRQHQNQIIGPVVDVLKYGIIGTATYGIMKGILRGAGDINVTNSGDGTVITDRSDNIASESNTDLTTSTDRSDHSAVSDPTIVEQPDPVIVEQPEYNDPIIVNPVIVDKDVVIVGE